MDEQFTRVDFRDYDGPIVRYNSGLSLYEEALIDTRWIARYWSPVGRVEADPVVQGDLVHNSAFGLEMDGQSLHRGWGFVGFDERVDGGQKYAIVTLEHQTRPVRVRVHTRVDGSPAFSRWLEIENTGDEPAALSSLWVWSGRVFPCQAGDSYYQRSIGFHSVHGDYAIGYFVDDDHSSEGNFQWRPLGDETIEIRAEGGRSGWSHPIAYLRDGKAGQLFVAQLAWSGNWAIRVESRDAVWPSPAAEDLTLFLRIGPCSPAPMRVLDPGETITTPQAHIGFVAGDLDEMVQGLHEHQRKSVYVPFPKDRANLVVYNNWGYMHHEMSEEKLVAEIDIAADVGSEMFIIDAGWYGLPGQPWTETGYWRPGERLPNGLAPVYDHARARGLLCGLWVWIEAASEGSALIQEHPDWLLHRDGHPLNNMLDLTNPEVAEWVESEVYRIIEEYQLDLFRLDYNASPGEGGYNPRHGYDENTIWRHYEAMYGLWERVRARHPNLLLENCSGGGGRTDLGIVSRYHYTWFSDYTLAPRTIRMQNGMMMAVAPDRLARVTGMVMNGHLSTGDLNLQMRMNTLLGSPGLSGLWPTPADANPLAERQIRKALGFYKQHIRPMIASCKVYLHTPVLPGVDPEGWCVIEYGTSDKAKAIVGVFRLAGQGADERLIRLRGVARGKAYRVWFDNHEEWVRASGRELIEEGVWVRLPQAMKSEMILVEELEGQAIPLRDGSRTEMLCTYR